MKPSNVAMSEVVVVGFGQQKKSSTVGSIARTENAIKDFGENEFITYYKTYHKADLCNAQKYELKAKFHIDEYGNPVKIKVAKSPCDEIKQEFIQLLNANKWTKVNRNVSLKIQL